MDNYLKKLSEFDHHDRVVKLEDKSCGLLGFIAIHRKHGEYPSLGATRLWKYPTETEALQDALRLSRLMSYKSALAGLPYGGAKAVLVQTDQAISDRVQFFSAYSRKVNELCGAFVTGSDVGLSNEDVTVMSQNSPYIIGQNVDAGYFTALGVFYGIEAVLEKLYGTASLENRSFAVQGLGKTGWELVRLLYGGAKRIVVAEMDEEKVVQVKKDFPRVEVVGKEEIHRIEVDVFSPCALNHAINRMTVDELGCKAICGAANNQLESPEIGKILDSRKILYAPDYLVNSGGLISVVDQFQNNGADNRRIKQRLTDISETLRQILVISHQENKAINFVADEMAERRMNGCKKPQIDLVQKYKGNATGLLKDLKDKTESHWKLRGEEQVMGLFSDMAARIPAYRAFLSKHQIKPEQIKTWADFLRLPQTNKENYLRSYPLDQLCWDGKFQQSGWVVSATSGSTGEPFYFPRATMQDEQFALTAELTFKNYFEIDKKNTLFIDCFGLGVWIGGMFMFTAVKSIIDQGCYSLSLITPGADKVETLKAIKRLAPKFDQIILGGYGPLVKDLIDEGKSQGIDWSKFDMKYFFAAEGFSEGFRDYIVKHGGVKNHLTGTINHYGTADLGTMAHETPLSIMIRRICAINPSLFASLFNDAHKTPTFAQYIPELFFFEEVNGELLCTGPGGIPLVRYNLKDRGGVLTFDEVKRRCQHHGVDIFEQAKKEKIDQSIWNLPFVYLYERTDMSVSLYGFNIYPETIHKALEEQELNPFLTGKFTMRIEYDQQQNQVFEIHIELKPGQTENADLSERALNKIIEWLNKECSEWRCLYSNPETRKRLQTKLVFSTYGDAIYFNGRGKQKWVMK